MKPRSFRLSLPAAKKFPEVEIFTQLANFWRLLSGEKSLEIWILFRKFGCIYKTATFIRSRSGALRRGKLTWMSNWKVSSLESRRQVDLSLRSEGAPTGLLLDFTKYATRSGSGLAGLGRSGTILKPSRQTRCGARTSQVA